VSEVGRHCVEFRTTVVFFFREGMDTVQHTKMMPECKNVTKQNCITKWEEDEDGNQVRKAKTTRRGSPKKQLRGLSAITIKKTLAKVPLNVAHLRSFTHPRQSGRKRARERMRRLIEPRSNLRLVTRSLFTFASNFDPEGKFKRVTSHTVHAGVQ